MPPTATIFLSAVHSLPVATRAALSFIHTMAAQLSTRTQTLCTWTDTWPALRLRTQQSSTPVPTVEYGDRSMASHIGSTSTLPVSRSEERRVGKECRSGWSPYH